MINLNDHVSNNQLKAVYHARLFFVSTVLSYVTRVWVEIRHDSLCQFRSEHKGRAGRCLNVAFTQSLSIWQATVMQQMWGTSEMLKGGKWINSTWLQPKCGSSSCSSPKCVFLPNLRSISPLACQCGSEEVRRAVRLSLTVFFKSERINGQPGWPSHALCTIQLLCLVVDLMLLTSIF